MRRSSRTTRSSATRRSASSASQGEAKITSPWTVEVADGRTATRHAHHALHRDRRGRAPVRAADSRASTQVGYLTSDTVWDLRELPQRLVVLGGGPIGCELAQCLRALRLAGDAGRDAAAHSDARGSRDLRDGDQARFEARRHRRARRTTEAKRSWSRTARRCWSASTRARKCASPSTSCWSPWGASPTPRATGWRSSASR